MMPKRGGGVKMHIVGTPPMQNKGESNRLTRLDAGLSGGDTSVTNGCDREPEWAAEGGFKRRGPGLGEAE